MYARLPFNPGFLALTFSYAAVGTDAIEWVSVKHPAGGILHAGMIIAALTMLVAAIAVRSVIAIRTGDFLPVSPRWTPSN